MSYPYQIKSFEEYKEVYKKSIEQPEAFWAAIAENFLWRKKWDKVLEWNFTEPDVKWFINGKLNITENCIDRHLEKLGEKPAIIWEPNHPEERVRVVTYNRLHKRVCQVAQMLKNNGVKKGDRVCIYMGMVPELVYAVLGCARIGAIHSVVFGGFSAQSIADRLEDANAEYIITCDGAYRGDKIIPLKDVIDDALIGNKNVKKVIVYTRTRCAVSMIKGRDVWWEDEMERVEEAAPSGSPGGGVNPSQDPLVQDSNKNDESQISKVGAVDGPSYREGSGMGQAAEMDAEDPLFILYTSGSTGKPKGVVHSSAGYMIWTNYSFVNVFQYQPGQIFFCTADIGWITGHSYIVYGPLSAGATQVMFEGIPTWPDAGRFWEIIDKHKVNILYTAPTAIRSLMGFGLKPLEGKNLSSLKVLGTVGEPINEEAWHWYDEHIGKGKCPIVDTWWQTETGGILISNLAGITPAKPSFATLPLPGVQPILVDENGKEVAPSRPSPSGKESQHTEPRHHTADPSLYNITKELAERKRKEPTFDEELLWQHLRNNQTGFHIRRQHIIGSYIVDFVCIDKTLTIEIDGGYHNELLTKQYDEARTQYLKDKGFKEIRFTNEQVRTNIPGVIEKIKKQLSDRPSSRKVSPEGGDLEGASPSIAAGNLCIKAPWPAIIRTTYGDHERCRQNYFSAYPNLYFTGDGALRDEEGNYRIT